MKLSWNAARVYCARCATTSKPLKGKKAVKAWVEAHAREPHQARPSFEVTIGASVSAG